jgi:hypothetical protein
MTMQAYTAPDGAAAFIESTKKLIAQCPNLSVEIKAISW